MSTKVTLSRIQVRIEMAAQDISCGELAKKASVCTKIVSSARSGVPIGKKSAEKIAKALGCKIENLIDDEVTYT